MSDWLNFAVPCLGRFWILHLFALSHFILLPLRCFLIFNVLLNDFQWGAAHCGHKVAVKYIPWKTLQLCESQAVDQLPSVYERGLAWSPFPECLQTDSPHAQEAVLLAGYQHHLLILFVYISDTIQHGICKNRRHCDLIYISYPYMYYASLF